MPWDSFHHLCSCVKLECGKTPASGEVARAFQWSDDSSRSIWSATKVARLDYQKPDVVRAERTGGNRNTRPYSQQHLGEASEAADPLRANAASVYRAVEALWLRLATFPAMCQSEQLCQLCVISPGRSSDETKECLFRQFTFVRKVVRGRRRTRKGPIKKFSDFYEAPQTYLPVVRISAAPRRRRGSKVRRV
jgi:hypothetical protein